MRLDRRRVVSLLALGASGAQAPLANAAAPTDASFAHGVASGDPLQDRVVLWSRVTLADAKATAPVTWELSETPDFKRIHKQGRLDARPERDHTLKVDVTGLAPGRDYHYRFRCGEAVSPTGRTRTLAKGATAKVTLAVVSCSLYPNGYFNAYDHIAKGEPVDAVIHLGDYIYEYGADPTAYGMPNGLKLGRIPEPAHEIVSLADYRIRHALYKRDPDLQAAHAAAPWICVWDDHELSNDAWRDGAENHQPASEGPWSDRKAAAVRAYYEWMPIREPAPGKSFEAINRSFHFGDLASLIMVETRLLARSQQLVYDRPGDLPLKVYDVTDPFDRKPVSDPAVVGKVMAAAQAGQPAPAPYALGPDPAALMTKLSDPSRQLLGKAQETWLAGELAASAKAGRPWQVLCNQVVMARVQGPNIYKALGREKFAAAAPLLAARPQVKRLAELFAYDVPSNLDGWDGYQAARERVYDAIKATDGNVIVLAGDSHAFWVNELYDAGGATRVAAEFGTTSVTSPSWGDEAPEFDIGAINAEQNREVLLCDEKSKGYIRLTLTPTTAVGELISVDILAKPYASRSVATYRVQPAAGPGVGPVESVSAPRANA